MPACEKELQGLPAHYLIDLPHIGDERGWLLVAQTGAQVPFDIRRLFVLHSIEQGASRGHHAHREQHQFLMMLAGKCEALIDDGQGQHRALLANPAQALYVPPLHWLELRNFSAEAVCAVLTSGDYDEDDYVRDRAEFDRLTDASAFRPVPSASIRRRDP